jgi:hypothetical protein
VTPSTSGCGYTLKSYRRVNKRLVYGTDGRSDFEHFPHGTPGAEAFYRTGRLPFACPEFDRKVRAAGGQTSV